MDGETMLYTSTYRARNKIMVQPNEMTQLSLNAPDEASPHIVVENGRLIFIDEGWYEVRLDVKWSTDQLDGTRFAHTKMPGEQPLHSEAIDAQVLSQLSQGRQLLRGNTIFDPPNTAELVLEVWHDSVEPVEVTTASLTVRDLIVPITPDHRMVNNG